MTAPRKANDTLSAEAVAHYLSAHPDYFQHHPNLLEALVIPHPDTGGATSLMQRQVMVLREQQRQLQRKLNLITDAANANERLLEKVQQLLLQLFRCRSRRELLPRIPRAVGEVFEVKAVALRLFTDTPQSPHEIAPNTAGIEAVLPLLEQQQPHCGYLSREQRALLFPNDIETLRWGIIIPLCGDDQDQSCLGLLAVGSDDPERFHPEMGTHYMRYLGTLLAGLLQRFRR